MLKWVFPLVLAIATDGSRPASQTDFDEDVAPPISAGGELPIAAVQDEKLWLQRQILELKQRLEKVEKQEQALARSDSADGVARSETAVAGVFSHPDPPRNHQHEPDAVDVKLTLQANPEGEVMEEKPKQEEAAGTVTVALLKEMIADVHSTLQDQHDSLKQQVDSLMQRQEDFITELRRSQRKLAGRRASDRTHTDTYAARTQQAKESLFEVKHELVASNFGDPDWVKKMKEGWDNGVKNLQKMLPNWAWMKNQLLKSFTFFLEGQSYALIEQARSQSSDLFADSLYQITMGLVQQSMDIIPNVLKDWAPSFEGLTQIMGLWMQSRAKIAFGDRTMPIMQDLTASLRKHYDVWRTESGEKMVNQVLDLARWFFCELTVKSKIGAFQKFGEMFCSTDTVMKAPGVDVDWENESSLDPNVVAVERPEVASPAEYEAAPVVAKEDDFWAGLEKIFQSKWDKFNRLINERVDAIFYPIFFQVAVPIAANMRLVLSQALCEFTIDLILEIINLIPVLNIPLGFVADDSAISVLHAYGNALLLQPVFESEYMENLEQKIKTAYSEWLLTNAGFKDMAKAWILRSYEEITKMARNSKDGDGPGNALEKLKEDQECSVIQPPAKCRGY
eukprot:TRINITY_DN8539_c0_g1_i1.p1 TRINITY_DN8539_c0_g1~~TRINITY_DN8539_c0_g1_i1.p1  ORF type:complete len:621 (-),score=108.74 TRINITY_DN8539_c0_g1_i1:15-1877(-)